ncbi:CPBP family intramembrane glutamic endopeptidase [Bacillus sp. Au-Bac7]|uniref:CPBP family intramembrane glutamic endopeptidase n=1 Tax=Bacillus sp. Au-Bac7 TaxID=2906458 RepID=UPI001E5060F0|nr:CPBP family intramembrane glutamic endopeptidase [Bacillus sp. Au-Bac7]MCE4048767.1 CPBP family intramembrane metalloprotease [Bacillus sp. Au-Bac7]
MKKYILNYYLWIFILYLCCMKFIPYLVLYPFYWMGVGIESTAFDGYLEVNKPIQYYITFFKLLAILFCIIALYKWSNLFIKRKLVIKWADLGWAILLLFLKFILTALLIGLLFLLGKDPDFTVPKNQQKAEEFIQMTGLSVITIIILAPIIEEFFFRKIIVGHLFFRHKYIGVIVSGLLFGGVHVIAGFTLQAFIAYTVMGLLFGFVYVKTGRLETSIIAHGVNNLIALLKLI